MGRSAGAVGRHSYEQVLLCEAHQCGSECACADLRPIEIDGSLSHRARAACCNRSSGQNGPVAWMKGGEFVIGCFESDKGKKYAMFVNRSLSKPCESQIAFRKRNT